MNVDWKIKLGSRKFWALLIGFIASLLLILGTDSGTIERVSGAVTALGSIAVYILAEAKIDTAAVVKDGEGNE